MLLLIRDYLFIAGFDAPAPMPDACLAENFPLPGGFGLVSSAAFFMRRARSIGVSAGASFGRSFILMN
jgi:hypothetical protein